MVPYPTSPLEFKFEVDSSGGTHSLSIPFEVTCWISDIESPLGLVKVQGYLQEIPAYVDFWYE